MKIILFSLIILLNTCTSPNMNPPNKHNEDDTTNNNVHTVTEVSNPSNNETEQQQQAFDYVVSEAAVGNIEGIPYTLDGIFSAQENNTTVLTTTMDIDKNRFVDIVTGTIVDWKEGVQLRVVNIEKSDGQQKGKVYFKVIKTTEK